ncbi:metalloproteinase inhibitor 2-like [Corythoichthys intestinalis]|uniref:metalloproteinase inhibitor 2-like n=1 Tax=Corythoichthys intestinalis TaxID=161448 RepID=UPI0025A5CF48|nr:metalloproteinase inhibitor 2-like [Corythoichthys intestinalis]
MSWLLKNLVLPLMLLCFWGQGAQACLCFPLHPQEAFCQSAVVITAKVLNKEVDNNLIGDEFNQPVKYEIKVTKIFKGPRTHIHAISTVSSALFCGVNLIEDKEYLIMTRPPLDGTLHINLCEFSQSWETLSKTQKNLLQHYGRGCDCKITPCYSLPCGFGSSQCWWTDFITPTSSYNQTRNYACVKQIDGSCAWQPGYP